jgi:hypothetical protein
MKINNYTYYERKVIKVIKPARNKRILDNEANFCYNKLLKNKTQKGKDNGYRT